MYDYSPKRAGDAIKRLYSVMTKDDYIDLMTPDGMQFRIDPADYTVDKLQAILNEFYPLVTRQNDLITPKTPTVSFEELYGQT